MNKENQSAAGLRRSAIAERIRLREEWSELKGRESQANIPHKNNILRKKQSNVKTTASLAKNMTNVGRCRKPSARNTQQIENILCGVVALVEVGSESRALPLRAALAALGATVLPKWSPLVTHLVWSQGGCRATRARARALACRLISPLWVEACAAASRRLPEQAFPAAARPSDLPSPKTLTRLLKKAEMENIPIADLLSDSTGENQKQLRLRISSEAEQDTTVDSDSASDTSHTTDDTGMGVKTAEKQQRPLPTQGAPPHKSRRKLFTQKEAESEDTDVSDDDTPVAKARKPSYHKPVAKQKPKALGLTIDRKELARAERLAKKLIAGDTPAMHTTHGDTPRIVLTGMSRSERRLVSEAVRALHGRLQASVDKKTTHVLVGTFLHDEDFNRTATGLPTLASTANDGTTFKPRTLNALCGAARGCRVLRAAWALHSKDNGKWMHYCGYEVPHLKKISEKARLERSAWGKIGSEYGYDVFCGMRVQISREAAQREPAIQLMKLCGAVVQQEEGNSVGRKRTQNGGQTQNGALTQTGVPTQNGGRIDPSQYYVTQRPDSEYDVRIGCLDGDVTSKWVFDSVAAGRMRNTRRYLVSDAISAQLESFGC